MTVAKTCISTFSSLHKGPCKPCIMQAGNLCPLSSFCGHCDACHFLLSVHATRQTPQPHRQRRRKSINGWAYLVIKNKALKALVWQNRLDGYVCNERNTIIYPCFIFFFYDIVGVNLYSVTERKRQADILQIALTWLKRAPPKDSILMFNALQFNQFNEILRGGVVYMVKHVRRYKGIAERDHTSQEIRAGSWMSWRQQLQN